MTEKPSVGTVVVLNSGGSEMTVTGPVWRGTGSQREEVPDKVRCSWFEGDERKSAPFHIAALRVVGD